jgi:hypothetical protein
MRKERGEIRIIQFSVSTVFEWPPIRLPRSYTVTSCDLDKSHAADIPAMPVPITAILRGLE